MAFAELLDQLRRRGVDRGTLDGRSLAPRRVPELLGVERLARAAARLRDHLRRKRPKRSKRPAARTAWRRVGLSYLEGAVRLRDDMGHSGGRLPLSFALMITIYEKPKCSTCRKLRELLSERGIDFESIDYHVTGLAEAELRGLIEKARVSPQELLRTREPLVVELGLDRPTASDEQLIAAMLQHPILLQRPIVVKGEHALLARPVERVLELL